MIDLEQLKRDREAGTPGPWTLKEASVSESPFNWWIYCKGFGVLGYKTGHKDRHEQIESWGHLVEDARRIARVPEMEARILSDADEITHLRADLAAAREQVAGAWVAATDRLRKLEVGWHDGLSAEYRSHTPEQMRMYAIDAIRSITPADATAALEARDARVRAEERAKVIEEAKIWALCEGAIDNTGEWVSWQIDTLHTAESRKALEDKQ